MPIGLDPASGTVWIAQLGLNHVPVKDGSYIFFLGNHTSELWTRTPAQSIIAQAAITPPLKYSLIH